MLMSGFIEASVGARPRHDHDPLEPVITITGMGNFCNAARPRSVCTYKELLAREHGNFYVTRAREHSRRRSDISTRRGGPDGAKRACTSGGTQEIST
jgi:hypothetical protein